MERNVDRDALFQALADDTSRGIIEHTAGSERSAQELADYVGVSVTTVYRRLEMLEDNDIVEESIQLDRGGHHHRVYRATISRIQVEVMADEIRTRVEPREDMADRFARLWREIRND